MLYYIYIAKVSKFIYSNYPEYLSFTIVKQFHISNYVITFTMGFDYYLS